MSLHVALVVFVPGCVALTWWQVARALGGNTLSWVYSVEWPIFAAYAVFMWWKLVHEDPVHEGSLNEGSLNEGSVNGGPILDETPTNEPFPGAARARQVPDGGAPNDPGVGAGETGGDDDELAAYNRYLAELNASGRQKRW